MPEFNIPGLVSPPVAAPLVEDKTKRLTFVREKECKGSVRYKCFDVEPIIDTIYVSRKAFATMPQRLVVEITPQSV